MGMLIGLEHDGREVYQLMKPYLQGKKNVSDRTVKDGCRLRMGQVPQYKQTTKQNKEKRIWQRHWKS